MSNAPNSMAKVGMVAWGLKNGYQVFFHSPHIDVKSSEIRGTLEDVRVLVSFSSVGMRFYSLEWTEDYKVFTEYLALYDWSNRKNAYLAMSLFVPHGQRMQAGAHKVLSALTNEYQRRYIGDDFKIKRITEDSSWFLDAVANANTVSDAKRKRPNRLQDAGYGLVKYQNKEELIAFFKNPYLREYKDYKEIFFLAAEQTRLTPSTVIKPVTTKDGQPLTPQPLTFPVSIRPIVPGLGGEEVDYNKLIVEMNGKRVFPDDQKIYSEEFPGENEQVSVRITYEGYENFSDSRKAVNWGADVVSLSLKKLSPPPKRIPTPEPKPINTADSLSKSEQSQGGNRAPFIAEGEKQKESKVPSNSTKWSKTGRPLNGPFTLQVIIKDDDTKEAILLNSGEYVKLKVTSLGGEFHSGSSAIELTGLVANDHLEGYITAPDYKKKNFSYTVRSGASSANHVLEPKTVFLTADKKGAAATAAGQGGAAPKNNDDVRESSGGIGKWGKVIGWVVGVLVLLLGAYFALGYYSSNSNGGTIKQEQKDAHKLKVDTLYEVNKGKMQELSDNHLAVLVDFKDKIEEAQEKGLRSSLIDSANNVYQDSYDYFVKSDNLLEAPKDLAKNTIDTAKVSLPTVAKLDSLFFARPLRDFKSRRTREYKEVVDFGIKLTTALDEKDDEDKKDERARTVLKDNAKIAEAVSNEAKLYDEPIYAKYIRWCTKGRTNNTYFETSKDRSRVLAKLNLLKNIASLDYLARTDFQRALDSINELKKIKAKDSRLTQAQKEMVQKKIDYAIANPPN